MMRDVYYPSLTPSFEQKYRVKYIMYEETIEISCESITGIKMTYMNDPVECLETMLKRDRNTNDVGIISSYLRSFATHAQNNFLTDVAACNGHSKCLRWLHKMGVRVCFGTCLVAARNGNMSCLKYIVEEAGYPGDDSSLIAAFMGEHLHCLVYLLLPQKERQHFNIYSQISNRILERYRYNMIYERLANAATTIAHFAILHLFGSRFDEKMLNRVVETGNLNCLKYLRSRKCFRCCSCLLEDSETKWQRVICDCGSYFEDGCKWDSRACSIAATKGHIECLKYLFENGCPHYLPGIYSSNQDCQLYIRNVILGQQNQNFCC